MRAAGTIATAEPSPYHRDMHPARALASAMAVIGLASAAHADPKKKPPEAKPAPAPDPTPAEETPWGKGVSSEDKAKAEALLGEGNDQFVQNNFREALAKYEQAVAIWDHPAIRFNMVRTLIALDRPLEAQASLERSLAYGKGPLEDQMYTEALNYQRLLASEIATLELACKQSAIDVRLDGQKLINCPGSTAKKLLPGAHVVVAAKPGYRTETKDLVLLPGKVQPLVIELITLEQATVYRQRWTTWKPWAVVAGGVVLAGLGELLDIQAHNDMDQLAKSIRSTCGSSGCTSGSTGTYESNGFAHTESRALTENKIGIAMMIAGGTVVLGGVAAVILNRPQPYVAEHGEAPKATARVVPTLTPDGGGLAVLGSF